MDSTPGLLLHCWRRGAARHALWAAGGDALDLTELEDSTLVGLVSGGRQAALEVLYDRYANLVYSFGMRMLGEPEAVRELTQEAFIRVWSNAGSFKPERSSFIKWLLSLSHNLGVEELRRRRARPQRIDGLPDGEDEEDGLAMLPDLRASTEYDALAALRRQRIRETLEMLPKEQRRAIELAYFQGFTQEEIARLTGEPLGTVKSRLRLSLRKLREVLQPEDLEVGLL